jgi:hypothetical protein
MLLLPKCVIGEIFTHGRHACSVHVTIGGLGQVLVGFHFSEETGEEFLHGGLTVPVLEEGELARLNGSVVLVDGGDVDLGGELGAHGNVRVLRSTGDSDEVDPVVELGVGRSNDSSVPGGEGLIGGCIDVMVIGFKWVTYCCRDRMREMSHRFPFLQVRALSRV